MFIDSAKIFIKAGDGARGCESWYQDKFTRYPLPDGGDGGAGGDIIIKANRNVFTLLNFRYKKHFKAKNGRMGSSNKKKGAGGENCVLEVPCGTQILDSEKNFFIRDLKEHNEQVIVAYGGAGGRGNRGNVKPQEGKLGEIKTLLLELKVIADVGIIGFPNAGKSSLVTKISTAKTKIASYPFTTKSPHLGLVNLNDETFMVADIPGLIEGAHKGKGLGDRFLKHVERTKIIVHLLDMADETGVDPFNAYQILNNELSSYNPDLAKKEHIVAANKMDLPGSEEKLKLLKKKIKQKIFPISCEDGRGIDKLLEEIAKVLWTEKS
ncbi:MAG: GTPase ObgE [Candidatus Omnitrophota bacterium]